MSLGNQSREEFEPVFVANEFADFMKITIFDENRDVHRKSRFSPEILIFDENRDF